MARPPFFSQVPFSVAFFFVSSRAKPRDPGSFSTPAEAPPITYQPRCGDARASFRCLCHSERVRMHPLPTAEALSTAEGEESRLLPTRLSTTTSHPMHAIVLDSQHSAQ